MTMMDQAARIAGLATAVPPHVLSQNEVVAHAAEMFGQRVRDFERLRPVFENTGIGRAIRCGRSIGSTDTELATAHRGVSRRRDELFVDAAARR